MGISRRQFLGWLSAAGVSVTAGSRAEAASNKTFSGYPGAFGILHDTTRCIGCRKCEEACNRVNALPVPEQPFDDLTVLSTLRRTRPDTFTVVNQFTTSGSARPAYAKTQCNHCLEPACASACFVKALRKVQSGAVIYDASLCVGCRYCMIACPFNIPTYEYNDPLTPRVVKCTMCHPLIEKGELPGCVADCPKEALSFGPRDRMIKLARQRIAKYSDTYIDHIYGEHEMGGTSWLYISDTPFSQIGMREDLGHQAASSFTAGPLAAVPVVVALWPVLLTGIYAISKRKDKIAAEERIDAVARTLADANEEMKTKLAEMKDTMKKEKEAAINLEVKRALEEAARQAGESQQDDQGDRPDASEEEN
jgi:Fe-S-cluster-containing dehydrogenase component